MPRARKQRPVENLVDDEPPSIEPYSVLSLARSATPEQIKSAYRKAALQHHPDKVAEDEKQTAHARFQEIAFAYAILSDPTRRERYDRTGSTAETLAGEDGDFGWAEYFREQFRYAVSLDAIAAFAAEYQGSEEERDDLLGAYTEFEGDMDAVFETIMCSDIAKDGGRFHAIIEEAIEKGHVEQFTKFAKENKKTRARRAAHADAEANEAEEHAKELGVHDALFGKDKGEANGVKGAEDTEADLLALIRNNQRKRAGFLDQLEAKYARKAKTGSKGKGKGKAKRKAEEEEEEEEDLEMEDAPVPKRSRRSKKEVEVGESAEGDIEMEEAPVPKKGNRAKKAAGPPEDAPPSRRTRNRSGGK